MHKAKILALNDGDEYEVTLGINNIELMCFAYLRPYSVQVGETYPVVISIRVREDLRPKEIHEECYKIERIGKGFEYILAGKLIGNKFYLGKIVIEDEYFDDEYLLDGKFIELEVRGFWVEFLKDF